MEVRRALEMMGMYRERRRMVRVHVRVCAWWSAVWEIHDVPLAAATVNMGMTYTMNLHSLCGRKLINPMNTTLGRRRVRMRLSIVKPRMERGKDIVRSFGRWMRK